MKKKLWAVLVAFVALLFSLSGGEEENEIISLRLYSGYSKW